MRRRTLLSAVAGAIGAGTAGALLDGRDRTAGSAVDLTADRAGGAVRATPPTARSVAIYVTAALARTARDTGYWSVVRPAARVAEQVRRSTDLCVPRLVSDPVDITENDNHRETWLAWQRTERLGDDDAAVLLTTTRDGEFDGYGGSGYAVVEAEDLVYYDGGPQATGTRTEPFVRTLAVALHEIGHALGLSHDDHAAVTMPGDERYVTLMGVGAPGVEYQGFVLRYSEAATRRLATRE